MDIDILAYQLYVSDMKKEFPFLIIKSREFFLVTHQGKSQLTLKYYVAARNLIRRKKIDKLYENIMQS